VSGRDVLDLHLFDPLRRSLFLQLGSCDVVLFGRNEQRGEIDVLAFCWQRGLGSYVDPSNGGFVPMTRFSISGDVERR
jgi:hypothetical protein